MSAGNEREFIDYLQKKEGGKAMKCPLLVAARASQHLTRDSKAADCLKEECAWRDKGFARCAILSLDKELGEIVAAANTLGQIISVAGQSLQKP